MENLRLIDFDDDNEQGYEENFKITDLESCNWAFRKLKVLDEQDKEVEELYEKELNRIDMWKMKELERNQRSREFFEGLIMEYFNFERMRDNNFKISTPYGKVSTRKQQAEYQYNPDEFIKWAETNGNEQFVRVKKEVNKSEVKKQVKLIDGNVLIEDTGEIVEGLNINERDDKIIIKTI